MVRVGEKLIGTVLWFIPNNNSFTHRGTLPTATPLEAAVVDVGPRDVPYYRSREVVIEFQFKNSKKQDMYARCITTLGDGPLRVSQTSGTFVIRTSECRPTRTKYSMARTADSRHRVDKGSGPIRCEAFEFYSEPESAYKAARIAMLRLVERKHEEYALQQAVYNKLFVENSSEENVTYPE